MPKLLRIVYGSSSSHAFHSKIGYALLMRTTFGVYSPVLCKELVHDSLASSSFRYDLNFLSGICEGKSGSGLGCPKQRNTSGK